jgi:hypothetical protein
VTQKLLPTEVEYHRLINERRPVDAAMNQPGDDQHGVPRATPRQLRFEAQQLVVIESKLWKDSDVDLVLF